MGAGRLVAPAPFGHLWRVAMAADGDEPRPSGGTFRFGSFFRRVASRLRLGAFTRGDGRRSLRRDPSSAAEGTHEDMPRTSEYLQLCEENAVDAYTVEDALYWHNEIITELSIELNLVRTAKWPRPVKSNMAAELEDRIAQHSAAVTRLAGVLEKNEPFIWQP